MTLETVILLSACGAALGMFGFGGLLAWALCRAAARADERMRRQTLPPIPIPDAARARPRQSA